MRYPAHSPRNEPNAAAAITASRFCSPVTAATPAAMISASLGTTGSNASTTAIATITASSQGDASAASVTNRSMSTMYCRLPWSGR
jgi:hypothetical protein